MNPLLRSLVGVFLILLLAGAATGQARKTFTPGDKESPGESEYFPLKKNTNWVYKTSEGKITIQVVKHEVINGVMCAHLVGKTADKPESEYVRIGKDGVVRVQAGGQNISPPLRILKLPVKDKDEWTVDSKVLGKDLKGTFKTSLVSDMTVLGKKYTDVVVATSDDFTVDGQNVPHTYYFAKGIGIVKQVVKFANQDILVELESFTPAEK